MLDVKITLKTYQLSHKSKELLYNPFFFYNLSQFLPKEIIVKTNKNITFKTLLLNKPISVNLLKSSNINFLIRSRILCVNNSFLFLETGKKYTLVKPKSKKNFKYPFHTELLFLSYKFFFKSLAFLDYKTCIDVFQYKTIKFDKFVFSGFYLKKIIFMQNKYSKQFFFIRLIKQLFSNFQKKINFFQFNTFFKKM